MTFVYSDYITYLLQKEWNYSNVYDAILVSPRLCIAIEYYNLTERITRIPQREGFLLLLRIGINI